MAAGTVDLLGKPFRVADKVGLMALLRFAHVAKEGATTDDLASLAAIYDVLRQVIHEDDWDAFQQWAMDAKASTEDLMGLVSVAMDVITAHPTELPSDSSDGQSTTPADSPESSFSLEFSPQVNESTSILPDQRTTPAPSASPLMNDPRVLELVPVSQAGAALRAG